MSNLPIEQISESQRLATQLPVEPDTKVVQGHFGRQTCLKAMQGMRTLTGQPESVEQLLIDGFNDLAQPGQPASPVFGPAHLAALMGRADHLCAILCRPSTMQVIACKAFVGDIDALGWRADTGQARRGMLTRREKG